MSQDNQSNQTQVTNETATTDENVTISKGELLKLIATESNKSVHAALALEKKKSARKPAAEVSAETAEAGEADSEADPFLKSPAYRKMQEKLRKLENINKEKDERERAHTTKSTISKLLSGKLVDDTADVAEEKFFSLVSYDTDTNEPIVSIDGTTYDLREGIEAWLNHDDKQTGGKRWRKAQKAMPRQTNNRALFTAPQVSNVNQPDNRPPLEALESIADVLASQGVTSLINRK